MCFEFLMTFQIHIVQGERKIISFYPVRKNILVRWIKHPRSLLCIRRWIKNKNSTGEENTEKKDKFVAGRKHKRIK